MGYGVAMPMRSSRHMRAEERETVSLGLAQGHSLRELAEYLGVHEVTVSRWLKRGKQETVPKNRPHLISWVPCGPSPFPLRIETRSGGFVWHKATRLKTSLHWSIKSTMLVNVGFPSSHWPTKSGRGGQRELNRGGSI
jgi:DNA-binding CsgD family transcriptional regulator